MNENQEEDIWGSSIVLMVMAIGIMGFIGVALKGNGFQWYVPILSILGLVELTMLILKPRFVKTSSKMADALFTKSCLICIYGGVLLLLNVLIGHFYTILKIIGLGIGGIVLIVGFVYLNSLLYKDKGRNKNGMGNG